ncbi:hypothetical protein LINPERPRIM_LOCUS14847, partial [Linum perenne]
MKVSLEDTSAETALQESRQDERGGCPGQNQSQRTETDRSAERAAAVAHRAAESVSEERRLNWMIQQNARVQ